MTSNRNKVVLATVFMFFISLFVILLLEGAARLIYKETRLDQISKTIAPHKYRIWSGRPDYKGMFFGEEVDHNSLGLRDKEITEDAEMIVFGASPSYGWGVKSTETYSSLIQQRFQGRLKVLNASNIGYSSHQGKKILNELLVRIKPKFVLISYVINDVDRYRFIQNSLVSDSKVKKMTLVESVSYFLSENMTLGKLIRSLSKGEEYLPNPGETRVPKSEYKSNYLDMIKAVRKVGARPILLKMPVNLHLSEISDKLLELLNEKGCAKHRNQSKKLYECLFQKGEFPSSKFLTNEVRKQFAINSSRKTEQYHSVLDEIGDENQIVVIDAVSVFRNSKDYLFLDKKEDPIHPNPLGHTVLADLIYSKLKDLEKGEGR